MSESLFSDAGAAPATETTQPEAAGQQAAPEVKPDAPWWERMAPGKYKTEDDAIKGYGENSRTAKEAAARLKALEPLEAKAKAVFGAPKGEDGKPLPYEYAPPKGEDGKPIEGFTVDREDPRLQAFEAVAHDLDLSPEVANRLFNDVYLPWQAGEEAGRREREEAIGAELFGSPDALKAAVPEVWSWASGLLGEDQAALDALREAGSSAAAIYALARLRESLTSANIGRGTSGSFGKAEYESLVAKATRGPLTADEQAKMIAYLNQAHPDQPEA